jgi:hypothetical protein
MLTLVTYYSKQLKKVTYYFILSIKQTQCVWKLHWMILLAYKMLLVSDRQNYTIVKTFTYY